MLSINMPTQLWSREAIVPAGGPWSACGGLGGFEPDSPSVAFER